MYYSLVSLYNKANTFAWYNERYEVLFSIYDPVELANRPVAIKVASEWGDKIPIGIIYRNDRMPFEEHFPVLGQGPLVGRDVEWAMLKKIMEGYR